MEHERVARGVDEPALLEKAELRGQRAREADRVEGEHRQIGERAELGGQRAGEARAGESDRLQRRAAHVPRKHGAVGGRGAGGPLGRGAGGRRESLWRLVPL